MHSAQLSKTNLSYIDHKPHAEYVLYKNTNEKAVSVTVCDGV